MEGLICLGMLAPFVLFYIGSLYVNKKFWEKTSVKKTGLISISKDAYKKAKGIIDASGSIMGKRQQASADPKDERTRNYYLNEAEVLARNSEILDYQAVDFPVIETIAEMMLAYDIQAVWNGYPDIIRRPNLQFGRSDEAKWKEKYSKRRQQVGSQSVASSPSLMFGFTSAENVIRSQMIGVLSSELVNGQVNINVMTSLENLVPKYGINIGSFSSDLWNLRKAMRDSEEFFHFITVIHHYFKLVDYATIRTIKEKF
jgi:hypothetical protein